MNNDSKTKLEELLKVWGPELPSEFTLGTIEDSGTQYRHPNLRFIADPKVLGLYFTDLNDLQEDAGSEA